MARLLIKSSSLGDRALELKLGVTRVGRSRDTDFPIEHPTVSSLHCEFCLADGGVILRDLESTNGTFVDGRRVREVRLTAGQTVLLGDVELLVESTDVTVAIPKFIPTDLPAPPVVLSDGSMICPQHPQSQATFQCTACKEIMCDVCVHRLRRRGGKKVLLLCPICSHAVERIGDEKKQKKKSFLSRAGETVKLTMARALHLNNKK